MNVFGTRNGRHAETYSADAIVYLVAEAASIHLFVEFPGGKSTALKTPFGRLPVRRHLNAGQSHVARRLPRERELLEHEALVTTLLYSATYIN